MQIQAHTAGAVSNRVTAPEPDQLCANID